MSISGVSIPIATAVRVDSADPARNTTSAPPNAAASIGTTTAGSPPSSFSAPVSSASDAIKLRCAGKWLVSSTSRISRPASVSLPTSATVPTFGVRSANLMLQLLRGTRRTQPAPHNAADPYHDAAAHVHARQRQQHYLRIIPDQINQAAQRDDP